MLDILCPNGLVALIHSILIKNRELRETWHSGCNNSVNIEPDCPADALLLNSRKTSTSVLTCVSQQTEYNNG